MNFIFKVILSMFLKTCNTELTFCASALQSSLNYGPRIRRYLKVSQKNYFFQKFQRWQVWKIRLSLESTIDFNCGVAPVLYNTVSKANK